MANLLHTSGPTSSGIPNLGSRNYDYTKIYTSDKPGEEAKENARVWNLYLDEAETHDADMIQGFRNILDGLLVFAALFSGVVTTFVAQTSQSLQPDNAQIMVSLLVETNQLLRAGGDRASINAVPAASLNPQSQTYTSTDVWVNGLFFTSLALSLSTALLSVLAKQWIQAYTAVVPGSAKTRTLIRQFRFQGLFQWKLGDIIEGLPLILHCSLAVFLAGLSLYISQLSSPICGVVAGITALTFLFYFGSSMIPAFDIACPYRIPFMFLLAQLLFFAFRMMRYICLRLWYILAQRSDWVVPLHWMRPLWVPSQSLKMAEHNKVLKQSPFVTIHLTHNSLNWVFNYSSNHSVKDVVIEGICGLLNELPLNYPPIASLIFSSKDNVLLSAIIHSLSRLSHMHLISSKEDEIEKNTVYGQLIVTFIKAFSIQAFINGPTDLKDWQEKIKDALLEAYVEALRKQNHILSQHLLDWSGFDLLQSDIGWKRQFLFHCAMFGNAEDFHDLLDRGIDFNYHNHTGQTALHYATINGNIDGVIALVEQEPALISAQAEWAQVSAHTALDLAILSCNSVIMVYLLDYGARSSSHRALYHAMIYLGLNVDLHKVELLLDCGWDRTVKDTEGMALIDIAHSECNIALAEYLEHYQTVRLPPYRTNYQTVD